MTAVVGILNKQAVAIAADSAVTISGVNGRKILNHANKIFRLSAQGPVGVMIYNSADFMGTSWDIIFKLFRDEYGKAELPTLKAYQETFMGFLRTQAFFNDPGQQARALYFYATTLFETISWESLKDNKDIYHLLIHQKDISGIGPLIRAKIDQLEDDLRRNPVSPLDDFQDFSTDNLLEAGKTVIEEAIRDRFTNFGLTLGPEHQAKLLTIITEYVRSRELHHFLEFYSGIVFVGFGAEELFPSLIPVNISFPLQNRLRAFTDQDKSAFISHDNPTAIRPFAQTDVIDTVLTGAAPSMSALYIRHFDKYLKKYNQLIVSEFGDKQPDLEDWLNQASGEHVIKSHAREMSEYQQQYFINPLIGAVASLSKEDLAEMAESLIYLTYLKRRFTFAEESVGGPVDVVIISKCDGFIWKKRKHYFKPELNPHFMAHYLH
jgi:hypothetical protein